MALDLNLPNTPQNVKLDEQSLFTHFFQIYEALKKLADNVDGTDTTTTEEEVIAPVAAQDYPLYIQDSAPSNPPSKYMWIQTGMGSGGNDFTVWFENGE